MASEDLVPSYLAEIFNRAVPDPLDDNSPFYGFASPTDDITVGVDTVTGTQRTGPFTYGGTARYAATTYGDTF